MTPPLKSAVEYARWEVIWRRKGRKFKVKFGRNYSDAEELYFRLLSKGIKTATLRCANVGFPPPERFQPRYVWKKRRGRRVQVLRNPMRKLNAAGVWWCPYCRRFRRVKEGKLKVGRSGKSRRPYWSCPECGVKHTNYYVYTYNPAALDLAYQYPYNYKTREVKN